MSMSNIFVHHQRLMIILFVKLQDVIRGIEKGGAIRLTEYDKLLEEARVKAEAFKSAAREYIPKMYFATRNENPHLTPEDARDRIEKDCINIWSKRTILDALPDEAKDLEKL
jgi:hypothetical protein